ncbi:T6SS immunity protein Tli4 family protein [Massilia arenae]|uniref:Tle cognate immunity protein 4 C-terminal domain-containing protein n=1 Tax=Massilia arenae TaxID=2603288 RepID=A0A5C7FVE3_9BURK|nr:T6SS immunity protein Tli4 family protein [Massilia arenae]TXG00411.1 hypothetical protein FVD38_08585 [Massilia arenae]
MKKFSLDQNSWIVALVASVAVAVVASYAFRYFTGDFMNNSSERVVAMFEKTRLACFGRFVISVPEDTVIIHGVAQLDGNFNVKRGKAKNIDEVTSSRLQEAEEEREYLSASQIKDLPLVGEVIDGLLPGQKLVFGARGSIGYTIHSYMPLGSDLFVLEVDDELNVKSRVQEMNRFASQLRLRRNSEIPGAPGFCVDGGVVDIQPEYENTAFGLHFKEFPDVRFSIRMRKNRDYLQESSSPSALRKSAKERASVIQLASFFARITTLREGRRQLNGWEGEEILTRRPEYKDDTDAHEFRFFSVGQRHDALHPLLDIRMDTGVRENARASVRPSLTDEAALVLWDKLLPTIRVRQPSDATPPNAPSSTVSLGSVMKSGDICPQSGWWECLEKRKIEGERRRFFKAGDKLSPVLADGGASLWNTLIGNTHQIATVEWKLLEYDPSSAFSVDTKSAGIPQADNDTKENDA